ncbi:hypothetical protein ADE_35270 [Achromobacter denitrificans]|nr:hypothetical protein ADE_35270 [Achromobacter denitrificans]
MSWANAGALTAAPVATAPSPARFKNERRCISLLLYSDTWDIKRYPPDITRREGAGEEAPIR